MRCNPLAAGLLTLGLLLPLAAETGGTGDGGSPPSAKTPAEAYADILKVWTGGEQARAEGMLDDAVRRFPQDARLAFFRAASTRSRFEVEEALPLFQQVVKLDAASVEGQCAALAVALDKRSNVSDDFGKLASLVEAHPKDPLLLWMAAVECRALDRNKEGIDYYRKLMEVIDPGVGPVLVHQTFANLLDEVGQHEEALKHRELAVKLEPEYWSFSGLGGTLQDMGRYSEAGDAFAKAAALNPKDGKLWDACGACLLRAKRYAEAVGKLEKAIGLLPQDARCPFNLAFAYCGLGRKEDAIVCFRKAAELDPDGDVGRQARAALDKLRPPSGK